MQAHPDLLQSNLWQIPVPEICIGKNFEFLFNKLLDRKLVTMALYRICKGGGNESPYVVTNPDFETPITHLDRAFVLGTEIPEDLQGDMYQRMEKEGSLQLNITTAQKETQADQLLERDRKGMQRTQTNNTIANGDRLGEGNDRQIGQ